MADYPWGSASPQKRISSLEASLKANDEKRGTAVEAHRKKLLEFDEADKTLRADLRVANAIAEKERKDTNKAEAVKILERLAAGGLDLGAAIRSGIFEKHLASAIETAVQEASKPKAAPPGKAPKAPTDGEPGLPGMEGSTPAVAPVEA